MITKISQLRKEIGLSQQELAEAVGVTRQTINALENGRYNPSLSLSFKITKVLKRQFIDEVFIIDD